MSEGRQEGEGVKDRPKQNPPETVAPRPKAAGETKGQPSRLSLGSSAVWTERMLATLERGITGGKWHSLIHQRYPNAYWADLGLISLTALAQGKPASPA